MLRWLADYWAIPLLVVGGIVAYVVWDRWFGGTPNPAPFKRVQNELAAIDAAREARAVQAEMGTKEAQKHIKEKYKAKREALDAKHEAKAKELEDDPVALARMLERLSRT